MKPAHSNHKITLPAWKQRLHEVIFEHHTRAGKLFDVLLLFAIFLSILIVMLDSVAPLHRRYGALFLALEWGLTILFTIEYILRLLAVARPLRYAVSFLGLIDLLAILPTFLSLVIPGSQSLLVLRSLRLLRIFRIFKLTRYLSEMRFLGIAVRNSMNKIVIFLTVVFTVVIILGSVM